MHICSLPPTDRYRLQTVRHPLHESHALLTPTAVEYLVCPMFCVDCMYVCVNVCMYVYVCMCVCMYFYFFLLYLLACSITLYLVILHAIYIELTVVIFTLIVYNSYSFFMDCN